MKKYLILFVLFIPVFFFTGWIANLATQTQEGRTVAVPITGYDPIDLLRGHYLRYQIDRNFNRAAYPDCRLPKGWNNRFFIPEESAEWLDQLFRSNRHQFSLLFSCQEGRKAIATELLIDGINWKNFKKENR